VLPQDGFLVAAPILPGRREALQDLLASMNRRPGEADPMNAVLPFGKFRKLHFSRFVILDDQTLGDLEAYGMSFPNAPLYLVFLGDCDGPARTLLKELAEQAAPGLRCIFAHCEGFSENADLLAWMRTHSVRAAASYVNFSGRTVRQIRKEAALHAILAAALKTTPAKETPQQCLSRLRQIVADSGPLVSPPAPAPVLFRLRRLVAGMLAGSAIVIAATLLLLTPLILLIPIFLYWLRRLEMSDPVITPLAQDAHIGALASLEDLDLVNQFSAFGSVKPGAFRGVTLVCILFALNFANRVLYARGRLARIGTIHFARWVLLDGGRRLFFASNYDRSLETYADDFVNKVAFGINLVFSNGIGFPRTRFLLLDGAKNERNYQHYLRRHQIVTQVWYNAYPGLTAFEINRNARIRAGLFDASMTTEQIRKFLALI
jgi:hypothetical protein